MMLRITLDRETSQENRAIGFRHLARDGADQIKTFFEARTVDMMFGAS